MLNPATLPIWVAGLVFVFFTADGRRYRPLGWIWVTLMAAMVAAQSSRPDRPAGVYPALFAAGAVLLERLLQPARRRVLATTGVGVLVACGLAFAPVGLPVLPPSAMAVYASRSG